MLAGACFAVGLTNFELIAYHISQTSSIEKFWIPLLLAISTAVGVLANLTLGRLYDRFGLPVVLSAVLVSSPLRRLKGNRRACLRACPVSIRLTTAKRT
jgi:MFS family permease